MWALLTLRGWGSVMSRHLYSLLISLSASLCSACLSLEVTYFCPLVPGDCRKYLLNFSIFLTFIRFFWSRLRCCHCADWVLCGSCRPSGGRFPIFILLHKTNRVVLTCQSAPSLSFGLKWHITLVHSSTSSWEQNGFSAACVSFPQSVTGFGPCLSSPGVKRVLSQTCCWISLRNAGLQWGGLARRR